MLDPYYLLGVELNATPDEIRTAYRRRAAEAHPDIQPPEKRERASERMKQLNAARDLLLDPPRRIEYDERMRVEMEKAKWRARRDAYAPPANYYAYPSRRRGWRQYGFTTLLAAGWLLPICLFVVLLLTPASQLSQSAPLGQLSAALFNLFGLVSFCFGPLLITLLLAGILRYWKR